jgi:hypothetical protein
MRRYTVATALLTAVVAVAVSCAHPSPPAGTASVAGAPPSRVGTPQQPDSNPPGDIPDSQAFVTFTEPDGSFTMDVPEGWARTTTPAGVTFTDNFNSVQIESRTGTTAPTPASARLNELAAIAAATPSVKWGDVSTVTRSAGPVILLTYQQDSAPNPVTGKATTQAVERYEFFRNGQTVALTLAAPVGADNVDPWRRVTDSFHWAR